MDNNLYQRLAGIEKTPQGVALMELIDHEIDSKHEMLETAEGIEVARLQGEIRNAKSLKESIIHAEDIMKFLKQEADTQSGD